MMSFSTFGLSSAPRRAGAYTLTLCLTIALLVTGCDSRFSDINENPNAPEQVSASQLLPNAIRGPVNTSVSYAHSTGNLVLQHTAKVQFNSDVDRYDWAGLGYWDALYNDLRNVQDVIRTARAADNPNYEAIGLVLKSWIFSMLTNAYGDIPYEEAVQARADSTVYKPAYDPQQEVYQGMLADLRQANELIDPAVSVQGDILYGGDMVLWKRLANSLRLRLLMRQSDQVNVQSALQEIVDNPSQYPIIDSNDQNAALTYLESRPNQWPIHTQRLGTFRTYRMSKTLTDTLQALDDPYDPRLPVFADTTASTNDPGSLEYRGVPNGLSDDSSSVYNGGSSNQSTLNRSRYFDSPTSAKGLIMTHAEVLFIKAEAAERGWISGDPQTFYENGIEASMAQYGIEQAPMGYFSTSPVAYASNNQERALEQIGTQKWIALFYTGMEAWFNWRRTGYPNIDPAVSNVNGNQIPVRFRYPSGEQSLNGEHYQEAVDRQGPDNINTEMWLLE